MIEQSKIQNRKSKMKRRFPRTCWRGRTESLSDSYQLSQKEARSKYYESQISFSGLLGGTSFPTNRFKPPLRRSSRRKSRGLGFCREGARPIPPIPIRAARHSGEGYEISVTSRGKIFWLTIAMLTERWTVSQAL